MKSVAIPAIICALVVALVAGILAAWPSNRQLHVTTWVRPHALERESIRLFDNGTFEASFSLDIGPPSKSVGTWHRRNDLKTDKIIVLEPVAGSAKLAQAYGQLFIRFLGNGEEVLVPGVNVVAFDAGDRFSEAAAFRREAVGAAR